MNILLSFITSEVSQDSMSLLKAVLFSKAPTISNLRSIPVAYVMIEDSGLEKTKDEVLTV